MLPVHNSLDEPVSWVSVAAGGYHTVAICSNGRVLALGGNDHGQCDIPAAKPQADLQMEHPVVVVAGKSHTVLVRSDGNVSICGCNEQGQCEAPDAPADAHYIAAAAGESHTVLLRSDGHAIACGQNDAGQCDIPSPPDGTRYVEAAAGYWHTVLIRDDGQAVAVGLNNFGQCDVPQLPEGVTYSSVAAGSFFTVLVRSDGSAVACGLNNYGQLDIPQVTGARYVRAAAGCFHAVLLLDDGRAVACGQNDAGQLNIPTPPEGIRYIGVASGGMHTVLLASDGHVVACGLNDHGQCNVPEPAPGLSVEPGGIKDSPFSIAGDSFIEQSMPDTALHSISGNALLSSPSPPHGQQHESWGPSDSVDLTDFVPGSPFPRSPSVCCNLFQEEQQEEEVNMPRLPSPRAQVHESLSAREQIHQHEQSIESQVFDESLAGIAESRQCEEPTSFPCMRVSHVEQPGGLTSVDDELDEAAAPGFTNQSFDCILSAHHEHPSFVKPCDGLEVRDLANKFLELDTEEDCHASPRDYKTDDSVSEELEEDRFVNGDVMDAAADDDSVPEELESSVPQSPHSPLSANQTSLSARSAQPAALQGLTPQGKVNLVDTPESSRASSPARSHASVPSTPATDPEMMGCTPREEVTT